MRLLSITKTNQTINLYVEEDGQSDELRIYLISAIGIGEGTIQLVPDEKILKLEILNDPRVYKLKDIARRSLHENITFPIDIEEYSIRDR